MSASETAGPETTDPDPKNGAGEHADGENGSRGSIYAKMALGMAMGTQFVGCAVGGVAAGAWLDGRYGTAPWGAIVGSVLGLTAGFTGLVRIGRRLGPTSE